MLSNNSKITSLKYDTKTNEQIMEMTFKDYVQEASADIAPPSGQTISPAVPNAQAAGSPNTTSQGTSTAPAAVWPGQGTPIQQGMTVGLKGPNGLPVPGQVSQVDQSANGVKVLNPTTGQQEWHGDAELQPFMARGNANSGTNGTNGTPTIQPGAQVTSEDTDLIRLRELAGLPSIRENASAGSTSAGSFAGLPSMLGKKPIQRQYTQEAKPVEYTPTEPAKTIIGDTKPNQASGKLSADLAARKMKSASRTNNGFKK